MPLDMEVGLGPGDIVLDGDPAPPTERDTAPLATFRPMSIVAKRSPISATAEHLLQLPAIAIAIARDCYILAVFLILFFPSTKFSTSLGRFSRNFATRRGMC